MRIEYPQSKEQNKIYFKDIKYGQVFRKKDSKLNLYIKGCDSESNAVAIFLEDGSISKLKDETEIEIIDGYFKIND